MRRIYDRYGIGNTTFSPLAGGLLTGKYNDGIPEASRYDTKNIPWYFNEFFGEEKPQRK